MKRVGNILIAMSLLISAATLVSGCKTGSRARADQQAAFLAGQNALLRQQQAQQFSTVTILGPVHTHTVPWVAGLTLAQAVATADYLGSRAPTEIIITAGVGDSATLDGTVLLNGTAVPLEAGDVVDIRY